MKQFPFFSARYLRRPLLTIAFVVICLLGKSGSATAQEFHYQFQLQGIDEPGAAKEVTDLLRSIFNSEEDPYEYFPSFNDVTDQFDFHSNITVTRQELETQLAVQGLVVLSFELSADVQELKHPE